MQIYGKPIMRMAIILLLFLASQIILNAQTINYTASTSIIANPERGLQKYSITASNYSTKKNANNLSISTLNSWKNSTDKVTVVYRYFMLNNFMNANINSIYLNNIQRDFDNIRNAGMKVIVRFAYSNNTGTAAQQPTKSRILSHINQLSPILNSNKDVIFSLQAGFIGTWGEWYYTNSNEFGTSGVISTAQWANRKQILDAMLVATPIEIPLQVRYVGIKTTLYGTAQLNNLTAYQNTANSRISFYNDAFLNDYGDQGTYDVSNKCTNPVGTPEYIYLSNETKYLPMTGETNGLNSCNSGIRTTGGNAIYEMGLTNFTTLNRDYYTPFWNQVINSIHYNDIVKNLGYRFVLNSSNVTSYNSSFDLNINITNVGFARPFKQRNVYLVMKNIANNDISTHLINTDIRTWENSVSINQNFNLGISGTYQLYLWSPDNASILSSNSDYSIQFANSGTWEATTGYNNLLQTINLGSTIAKAVSSKNILSISPNPSSDYITIQLKDSDQEHVQIYNSMGQLVKELMIFNNERVDVSGLLKGIYFIRINNNAVSNYKFIKQ